MEKSSSQNSILSDSQAENFYFQVKFINYFLREIISFTKTMTLETGASLVSTYQNVYRAFYVGSSVYMYGVLDPNASNTKSLLATLQIIKLFTQVL